MLEVLELTILPGFLYFSTFSKISCLMSNLSTTTSIIQSTSFIFLKSSSRFPTDILLAYSFLKSGAGLDLIALFRAFWATLFLSVFVSDGFWGKMSSIKTSRPTFANWHAIPEPMTPEPKTATFFIR